jgi:hypothetical protein
MIARILAVLQRQGLDGRHFRVETLSSSDLCTPSAHNLKTVKALGIWHHDVRLALHAGYCGDR